MHGILRQYQLDLTTLVRQDEFSLHYQLFFFSHMHCTFPGHGPGIPEPEVLFAAFFVVYLCTCFANGPPSEK